MNGVNRTIWQRKEFQAIASNGESVHRTAPSESKAKIAALNLKKNLPTPIARLTQSIQFSTRNPGTRANSLRLFVTSTSPRALA